MDELKAAIERELAIAYRVYVVIDVLFRHFSPAPHNCPPTCWSAPPLFESFRPRVASLRQQCEKAARDDVSLSALQALARRPCDNLEFGDCRTLPVVTLHLLGWWAVYGDFEAWLAGLMDRTPVPKPRHRNPFRRSGDESERVPLARLRDAALGDRQDHPLAWYCWCKHKWPDSLNAHGVRHELLLHGLGGYRTSDDIRVEFFDAVTRAASVGYVVASAFREGRQAAEPNAPSESDFLEAMHRLGIHLTEADDSTGEAVVLRPAVVCEPIKQLKQLRTCVRKAKASAGNRITPSISVHVRPRSMLETMAQTQKCSASFRELAKQASECWPSRVDVGKWLSCAIDAPTVQACQVLRTLSGLIVLGAEARASSANEGLLDSILVEELLSLDSMGVAWNQESASGQRVIPWRATTRDHVSLVLRVEGRASPIAVGRYGRAASCGDNLFWAVAAYDRHVWAIAAISEMGDSSHGSALVAIADAAMKSGGWGEEWETLKNELLATPASSGSSVLVTLFPRVRSLVLQWRTYLPELASYRTEQPLVDTLTHYLDVLQAEIVAAISGDAHEGPARLSPPRCGDKGREGEIDLDRWLSRNWKAERVDDSVPYDVRATASSSGFQIIEHLHETPHAYEIYVPEAEERDISLMSLPGVLHWSKSFPPPKYVEVFHDALADALLRANRGSALGIDRAVTAIKNEFFASQRAAFDALVHDAIYAEPSDLNHIATAYLAAMRRDERFAFQCFPCVSQGPSGDWRVDPVQPEDEWLAYDFSNTVNAKADISIQFASGRDRALRVISRGAAPTCESEQERTTQAWAGAIMETLVGHEGSLRASATVILDASDRHMMFGIPLNEGCGAAADLLDALACRSPGDEVTLDESTADKLFASVRGWLSSVGVEVWPEKWTARDSSSSDIQCPPDVDQGLGAVFAKYVPKGGLKVERFRLARSHLIQRPFSGSVSAGWPVGYDTIDVLIRSSHPTAKKWGELIASFRELAPAVLEGTEKENLVLTKIHLHLAGSTATENGVAEDVWHELTKAFEVMLKEGFGCDMFPSEEVITLGQRYRSDDFENDTDGDERLLSGQVVRITKRGLRRAGKVIDPPRARREKEP
jgi:hypothetical protein